MRALVTFPLYQLLDAVGPLLRADDRVRAQHLEQREGNLTRMRFRSIGKCGELWVWERPIGRLSGAGDLPEEALLDPDQELVRAIGQGHGISVVDQLLEQSPQVRQRRNKPLRRVAVGLAGRGGSGRARGTASYPKKNNEEDSSTQQEPFPRKVGLKAAGISTPLH
jgi:hypothetical protein